jgi:hypothetical protein
MEHHLEGVVDDGQQAEVLVIEGEFVVLYFAQVQQVVNEVAHHDLAKHLPLQLPQYSSDAPM